MEWDIAGLFLPRLRKEQFQQLGPLLQRLFIDCVRTAELPESQIARAMLALGAAHFDRQTDRSVLAKMSQFGQETTCKLPRQLDISSNRLHETWSDSPKDVSRRF